MERIIETIKLKCSNADELQDAIARFSLIARMASSGRAWQGGIHLTDEDGFSVTHLELVQGTLTDGSLAYDMRVYFAVPDFSQPDGIAERVA